MKTLLTAERAILESLSRSDKSCYELSCDTGVDATILNFILDDLLSVDLIECKEDRYYLNSQQMKMQSRNGLRRESKRLLCDLYDSSAELHLQKVWLTEYEKIYFDQLTASLKVFIEKAKRKSSYCNKTKTQEVIVWGHASYGEPIKASLSLS